MNHYEFAFLLERDLSDQEVDHLFEAGFEGVTYGNGRGRLAIEQEAPTLTEALEQAITKVRLAGFEPVAIEEEDLVSRATIASRLGITPQYVHLLVTGKRGPGGFPIAISGDGWALYSWTQVAEWARHHLKTRIASDDDQRTLAMANLILRARALASAEDKGLIDIILVGEPFSSIDITIPEHQHQKLPTKSLVPA